MDRRGFLKTSVVVGGTALAGKKLNAQEQHNPEEFIGILVDTTRCIGCRACEIACGETHDLIVPDVLSDGALEKHRKTSEKQWTVVNKFETEKGCICQKTMYALLPGRLCHCLPYRSDVQDPQWTGDLEG